MCLVAQQNWQITSTQAEVRVVALLKNCKTAELVQVAFLSRRLVAELE